MSSLWGALPRYCRARRLTDTGTSFHFLHLQAQTPAAIQARLASDMAATDDDPMTRGYGAGLTNTRAAGQESFLFLLTSVSFHSTDS